MPGRKNSTSASTPSSSTSSAAMGNNRDKTPSANGGSRRESAVPFPANEELQKCAQTLLYTSKLLFPKYPASFFPLSTLIEYMKHFKRVSVRNNRFKVRPMPDHLFDQLLLNQNTHDETIYSDHTIFVSDRIYKKFVTQDNLNWVQLTILVNSSSSHEDSLDVIRGSSNPKLLVPIVRVRHCQNASVFMKETIFENFLAKLSLPVTLQALDCALSRFDLKENAIPELITSASVQVINHPYELPNDLLDHILRCYFMRPRYLFTNFTYALHLNESLVGNHFFSRYHQLFSSLRHLHIRCLKLESKNNNFEIHGIVLKSLTSLKEVPSKDLPLPRRHLHALAFARIVPDGLQTYFKKILADTMPFIVSNRNAVFAKNKIFPVFMVHGPRGSGKAFLVDALAGHLGYHLYRIDCNEVMGQVAAQTETKLNVIFAKHKTCQPLILWWDNFEVFGVDNEGNEDARLISTFQSEVQELYAQQDVKVIIIVTSNCTEVKPFLKRLFLDTIDVQPPNQGNRLASLRWIYTVETARDDLFSTDNVLDTVQLYGTRTSGMRKQTYTALSDIAEQTQGFGFEDLRCLFRKTNQSRKMRDKAVALCNRDFESHLVEMEKSFGETFGAPKVPQVLWSDIGGLWKLKDEIQNSIGLPLKHIHLMGKSMRRSGILLYGPPGTGKTLVAKAVATECNLNFLAVQGPELLNMYVGQSEQNVREIFARARAASPCVIFLDELDSLAPNRGVAGDSGGVMDRVVSQLLAEMDGLSSNKENIFILAATNRPDLIDPALLRPGRFDKLLYVGPCVTAEDKQSVLEAQTKKFCLDPKLKLAEVVKLLTMDLTGADMYSICSNTWLVAVRRIVAEHKKKRKPSKTNAKDKESRDEERVLTSEDVKVNWEDFKSALTKFVPSINAKDMEYFNKLKASFSC